MAYDSNSFAGIIGLAHRTNFLLQEGRVVTSIEKRSLPFECWDVEGNEVATFSVEVKIIASYYTEKDVFGLDLCAFSVSATMGFTDPFFLTRQLALVSASHELAHYQSSKLFVPTKLLYQSEKVDVRIALVATVGDKLVSIPLLDERLSLFDFAITVPSSFDWKQLPAESLLTVAVNELCDLSPLGNLQKLVDDGASQDYSPQTPFFLKCFLPPRGGTRQVAMRFYKAPNDSKFSAEQIHKLSNDAAHALRLLQATLNLYAV